MDTALRIPTNEEYDQLIKLTGGDDTKVHWRHVFSWVADTENEYGLDTSFRVDRGCLSARYLNWSSSGYRGVNLGFRPACDLSPDALTPVKEGERMVMGTLYMAGEPVKVPENPTGNGDIAAYIHGSALELREALDDPNYKVMGYRIGGAVIADRCLLNMISYSDIEANVVGSGMTGIKPSICLNGQTFSVDEVARALGIQADIQTVRLCQPCRSGTILAELDLREEELSGIDLALQIPVGDSTEEFRAARCSQREEGTSAPRVEVYGRRGGYTAYGPLDTRSQERVEEEPVRDKLIVGGGQFEGVLDLYVEDADYVDYKGICPEGNYCQG